MNKEGITREEISEILAKAEVSNPAIIDAAYEIIKKNNEKITATMGEIVSDKTKLK